MRFARGLEHDLLSVRSWFSVAFRPAQLGWRVASCCYTKMTVGDFAEYAAHSLSRRCDQAMHAEASWVSLELIAEALVDEIVADRGMAMS